MLKNKFNILILTFFLSVFWVINSNLHFKESELSRLMRNMNADAKVVRLKIISGEKISKFNKKYSKIFKAKASADSKKGEHFEEYAQLFLKQTERLYLSELSEQKLEFNNWISTCVRCHETYCPGPLSSIKKMKIAL
jgi:cytochrome c553